MSTMLTREWRTDAEVTDLRERLAAHLKLAGSSSYVRKQVAAWTAVLDWVGGGVPAPVTGTVVAVVDDAAVLAEMRHAEDAERTAMVAFDDGEYAGHVGTALSWLRREASTRAPV